ncbi:MAG: 6,7-dimethyl-8-ribityllumazine synthase [Rhodospirillales bacterium 70-18]|nr:6,7-dimethyl-8-ribityllumazine synthase [Rhodospirillales bacterium]OJY76931.1 MAG: 6,7-dimethyl-8-ribityllumazine synthase [Rhodospirillales bacterium 70-18]
MSTADAPLPKAPVVEGARPHMLVVRAPYYTQIVDGLREGAERILREAGATFDVLDVAGALELAAAVRLAVRGRRRYDGYVVLGCVVKGETDHYEHVCREAMAGLTQVALQFALCLGNGLLTVATEAQALERSGQDGHNKGAEAAAAALVQISAARWLDAV